MLRLLDHRDEPFVDTPYELDLGHETERGKTDGDGKLEINVPLSTKKAALTLRLDEDDADASYTWQLKVGYLDPISEVSGVQARLHNLGYPCGPINGICGELTDEALRDFQAKCGIEDDDPFSDATVAALEDATAAEAGHSSEHRLASSLLVSTGSGNSRVRTRRPVLISIDPAATADTSRQYPSPVEGRWNDEISKLASRVLTWPTRRFTIVA